MFFLISGKSSVQAAILSHRVLWEPPYHRGQVEITLMVGWQKGCFWETVCKPACIGCMCVDLTKTVSLCPSWQFPRFHPSQLFLDNPCPQNYQDEIDHNRSFSWACTDFSHPCLASTVQCAWFGLWFIEGVPLWAQLYSCLIALTWCYDPVCVARSSFILFPWRCLRMRLEPTAKLKTTLHYLLKVQRTFAISVFWAWPSWWLHICVHLVFVLFCTYYATWSCINIYTIDLTDTRHC